MRGSIPGEFEQVVLLALAACKGEAAGREVYDIVTESTGREVSVAAVHITLTRLAEKGWATVRTAVPDPHVGGKPRKRYALSPGGAAVLTDQKAQLERLWGQAAAHDLLRSDAG